MANSQLEQAIKAKFEFQIDNSILLDLNFGNQIARSMDTILATPEGEKIFDLIGKTQNFDKVIVKAGVGGSRVERENNNLVLVIDEKQTVEFEYLGYDGKTYHRMSLEELVFHELVHIALEAQNLSTDLIDRVPIQFRKGFRRNSVLINQEDEEIVATILTNDWARKNFGFTGRVGSRASYYRLGKYYLDGLPVDRRNPSYNAPLILSEYAAGLRADGSGIEPTPTKLSLTYHTRNSENYMEIDNVFFDLVYPIYGDFISLNTRYGQFEFRASRVHPVTGVVRYLVDSVDGHQISEGVGESLNELFPYESAVEAYIFGSASAEDIISSQVESVFRSEDGEFDISLRSNDIFGSSKTIRTSVTEDGDPIVNVEESVSFGGVFIDIGQNYIGGELVSDTQQIADTELLVSLDSVNASFNDRINDALKRNGAFGDITDDPNGTSAGSDAGKNDVEFDAGQFGQQLVTGAASFIGSQLADAFFDDNEALQIASEVFLSTSLSTLAKAAYGDDFAGDIANSLATNLVQAGVSAVGNLVGTQIGGELADAIGVNAEYGELIGGIFGRTAAQQVGAQVAEKLGFQGFGVKVIKVGNETKVIPSDVTFQGALVSAAAASVGSYFGSKLATTIFDGGNPKGQAIGGAIGSIGATAAASSVAVAKAFGLASLGPNTTLFSAAAGLNPVGIVALAAVFFAGSFFGTSIGGLFGGGKSVGPIGHSNVRFRDEHFLVDGYGSDNGLEAGVVVEMGQSAADFLNIFTAKAGGRVANVHEAKYKYGKDVTGYFWGRSDSGTDNFGFPHYGSAEAALQAGALHQLKSVQLEGGDIYVKRALYRSTAQTLAEMDDDLTAAWDWSFYRTDEATFLAMVDAGGAEAQARWAESQRRAAVLQLDTALVGGETQALYDLTRAQSIAAYEAEILARQKALADAANDPANWYYNDTPDGPELAGYWFEGKRYSFKTPPQTQKLPTYFAPDGDGGPGGDGGGALPIVLDLDGDGLELVHFNDSPAQFELDASGFKHRVGWVAPDDGFLAYDKDGDGLIAEFDEIAFRAYVLGAETDLDGLKFFDSNDDGVLSSADAEWSKFGVWRDIDQDGITDVGEFVGLDASGITDVTLASDGRHRENNGNVVLGTGRYGKSDGSTGSFGDVGLGYGTTGLRQNADGSVTIRKDDGTQIRAAGDGVTGISVDLTADGLTAAYGGDGADVLTGGDGDEKLVGGAGSDTLHGGGGQDIIVIDDADNMANISGGDGSDTLVIEGSVGRTIDIAAHGFEAVVGGEGNDVLSSSATAPAAMVGGGGDDTLTGNSGDDRLDGGSGDDVLVGGAGDDILIGGTGEDDFSAGAGDDILMIDSDDRVVDDQGGLLIDAGDGFDLVIADGPLGLAIDLGQINAEMAIGGISSDVFWTTGTGAVNISGQGADDALFGGAGDDQLDGGTGDDALAGGGGADLLTGGIGRDTAVYGASATGVDVNLATRRGSGGDAEGDVLQGIENLSGSDHDDVLTGDTEDNLLQGGEGIDILTGGRGDDALEGGLGDDIYVYGRGDGIDHMLDGHWYDEVTTTEVPVETVQQVNFDYQVLTPVTYTARELYTYEANVPQQVARQVNVVPITTPPPNEHEPATIVGWRYYDSGSWLAYTGNVYTVADGVSDNAGSKYVGDILETVYVKEIRQEWRDVQRTKYEYVTHTGTRDAVVVEYQTVPESERMQSDGGIDTLKFGAGITLADLVFGFDRIGANPDDPHDLLFGLRSPLSPDIPVLALSDRVRLVDWANADSRIEKLQFSDGSVVTLSEASVIEGDATDEMLTGTAGTDFLAGAGGDDHISGEAGDDYLSGGTGDDRVRGKAGADLLYGEAGDDRLLGGDDDDALHGGSGADWLDGGAGSDTASYAYSGDEVAVYLGRDASEGGEADGDRLRGVENVIGSAWTDTVVGNTDANVIDGGGGSDRLTGGSGDDTLIGGSGFDTAVYRGNRADYEIIGTADGLTVRDLNGATNGDDGTDTLTGIERLQFADQAVLVATLPFAIDGIASVGKDGSVAGQLSVADDATAPELLTYAQEQGPAHGTLTLNTDGSWTYTPSAGYTGTDSFDYRVTDADGNVSVATIDVEVTPPTTAVTAGSEIQINTHTALAQSYPSVAVLADGSFVVVWYSDGQDGGGMGAYGQRFDAAGNALGTEFLINTHTTDDQRHPRVSALSGGGFVVVWESNGQDGSGFGVNGQRHDASGNKVGGEFRVNASTTNHQQRPSVSAFAGGGFVVVWFADSVDGSQTAVVGQRYTAAGVATGPEFQINTHTAGKQYYPRVRVLSDDSFVVTWGSDGQDGDGFGVYGQRYDVNGTALGSEFRVNSYTAGAQDEPMIAELADGGFVVAWHSRYQDGSEWGVYGQRYDASGNTIGGEFQINTHASDIQFHPVLAGMTDGGFVAVWYSNLQDGSADGVYGQRYDALGRAVGGEFQINDTTLDRQIRPSVAARADGGFVVSWASVGQDGSEEGIVAKVYAGAGGNNGQTAAGSTGDDGLAGGAGADTLTGNAGDDVLSGNAGDDVLDGGSGDDRLEGGAGDDQLSGGSGEDVAVYGGNVADYAVRRDGAETIVEDLRVSPLDGTDALVGVESLAFADQTISVAGLPDAAEDQIKLRRNGSFSGQLTATDAAGLTDFTYAQETGASHGTLTINADGTYDYQAAAGYIGTDSFSFRATGTDGMYDVATVTVDVVQPTAIESRLMVRPGRSVSGRMAGWEFDDGVAPQTYAVETAPSHGSLTLNADGTYTYTAAAGFEGIDTFDVRFTDSLGDTDVATISVDVFRGELPVLEFDGNSHLKRTPTVAGNRRTFTVATWVYRNVAGGHFFSTAEGTGRVWLGWSTDDRFYVQTNLNPIQNVATAPNVIGAGAWHHVVVAIDTTQATASDRVRIHVDGVQVTSLDLTGYPPQNMDLLANHTVDQFVGTLSTYATQDGYQFNGNLADFHLIDGQALDASSFGTFVDGQWRSTDYSGAYGTNGFHLDFTGTASIGADASSQGNNLSSVNLDGADVSEGPALELFDDQQVGGGRSEQILQFDGNGHLERTPTTAGNRKVYTLSTWLRRDGTGDRDAIFSTAEGPRRVWIGFSPDDRFTIQHVDVNGPRNLKMAANAMSAGSWHHLVVAVDTTDMTTNERVKLYVNGQRVTTFDTELYPAFDTETHVNDAIAQTVGTLWVDPQYHFNGALADFHLIDGQALDASSFGVFVDGQWRSTDYSGAYGTNGFHLDFTSTSNIGTDASGQNNGLSAVSLDGDDVADGPVLRLSNGLTLNGTIGHDILLGRGSNDRLDGDIGDDVLEGAGGADTLVGGEGSDWASYATSTAGVSVDLSTGSGASGHADGDQLIGIENLAGSSHDDTLIGDGNANIFDGGGGNDTLIGGSGDDVAVYAGNIADYWIRRNGVETVVEDRRATPADGTDTLTGIETLRFTDGDIDVAALPETADGVVSVGKDNTVAGQLAAVDAETASNLLIFAVAKDPANGTLTLNADGSWSYTPAAGYAGADRFDYKVTDTDGNVSVAIMTIDVVATTTSVTAGPELQANSHTSFNQHESSIGVLSDNSFIAVWTSAGQDGSDNGVFGRRFNATGTALGGEFQINGYTAGAQEDPSIAVLSNNNFVAVWKTFDQDSNGWEVYGRRFDASGNALATEFRANTHILNAQIDPAIAALDSGGFVIVWSSSVQDGSDYGVYGQRYDAAGNTVGGEFLVNTTTQDHQFGSRVVGLSGGGFVVVWQGAAQDGSDYGIYGQRFDATGTKLGTEVQINTETQGEQILPSIASLADGGFVVMWRSGGQDGDGFGVFGQRFDSSGVAVGSEFQVNSHTTGAQEDVTVTGLADGGFLATWQSFGQDGSADGIYAQRYDSAGNSVGGEFRVNETTPDAQTLASVTARQDGGFVVTWASEGQDGSAKGVYAKVYAGGDDNARSALGSAERDSLAGDGGGDVLSGKAGDDILRGNGGNDVLDGGAGHDIAIYGGNASDYWIRRNGSETVVEDRRTTPADGTDTLTGIETLRFADGDIVVAALPETVDSVASVDKDGSVTGKLSAVDDVTASNLLTYAMAQNVANGTLTLAADGSWSYTPDPGYCGADSFDYRVTDADGNVSVGQVVIDVHDEPAGLIISGGIGHDMLLGDDGSDLLNGAAGDDLLRGYGGDDVLDGGDGDDIAVYSGNASDYWIRRDGVEAVVEDRRTTPADGTDTLTGIETLRFADGDIDVATLPTPVGGIASVGRNGTVNGQLGATDDATAPELLTYALAQDAAHGQLTLNADGSWTYTASPGYTGADSFDYKVTDADGNVAVGQITIDVADQLANVATSEERRANTFTAGFQAKGHMATLPDGGFVVAWRSDNQEGTTSNVYAQRFDATGEAVGTEFRVNSYTTSHQENPRVASFSNGAFIIVWWSDGQDGSSTGIFGQRYDANGMPVGGEFQVNTTTAGAQRGSDIAVLPDDGFVVTWSAEGQDGSERGIYGQRYDAAGVAVGGEFQINTHTAGMQSAAVVTALLDGGFVVTWRSDGQDGNGYGVHGQRFAANGSRMGAEFQVNSHTTGDQLSSAIGALHDGGFIVVWVSNGQDGAGFGVYAQRYDATGGVVGPEFRVNTQTANNEAYARVTALADGGFVIAWMSHDSVNAAENKVFARRYDAGGNPLGDEFQVSDYTPGTPAEQRLQAIDARPDGGFVISWQSFGQDGSDYGIYSKVYGDTEFQVNSYTTGEQSTPSVAVLSDGGHVVVWRSNLQDGSGYGVYGQRYDPSGTAVGGEFRVNSHTVGDQYEPRVAALSDGGFVVVWPSDGQDGGGLGIYGQRYDAAGAAVGGEFRANSYTTDHQWAPSVAGLLDGGYVIAWRSSGQDGDTLGVYGQRYDATGMAVSGEFRINTTTVGDQRDPWVIGLSGGGFAVVWTSSQDGSIQGITGQRYDAAGVALGGEFEVNTHTNDIQAYPAAAALSDGGFVVVWQSLGQDGSGYGVYGQRYDASGVTVGGEFQVNSHVTGAQSVAAVTALADGGFLVSWSSDLQDGGATGMGAYAQRYDATGNAVGDEFRLNDYTAGDQSFAVVAGRADGGFVAAWKSQDQDGSGYGVYAKVYEGDGQSLSGSDGNDALAGSVVSDTLNGASGDDVLRGNGGDDVLDGGAGTDVAVYGGNIADYWVRRNGGETIVEDRRVSPADGTDRLTAIETLRFADGDVDVASLPEAADGVAAVGKDATVDGQLGAIDDATSPELLTYTQAKGPANGTLTLNADGSWTYTPDPGYTGADGFDYKVTDGDGNVSVARIAIDVVPTESGIALGEEVQVNSHTAGIQSTPSIAVLPDGGHVVVWRSDGQDGSGYGVYGQRFDAIGNVIGAEFRVNTYNVDGQYDPRITALSGGGFVVVWHSSEQDGSNLGIYGQRYDASGMAVGNEFRVNTHTADIQNVSAVGALADGGFVVAWRSNLQDGDSYGVYGQRYDASGATVGGEFRINTTTVGDQRDPAVVGLAGGGFAVIWASSQDGSIQGITGQRFDVTGVAVGGEFEINTYSNDIQSYPAAAALADGGFVAIWQSLGQDGSSYGIYGQRYDGIGATVGGEFQVNTYTTGAQSVPTTTALADGGFLVSWSSDLQDGGVSGSGAYAQRYDAAGNRVGKEFRLNDYTAGDQSFSVVAGRPDGGFVAAWHSFGQDGSDYGVYTKVFGDTEFQVNSYTSGIQREPSVATLSDGSIVVIWRSDVQDGSSSSVFGQRFDANGAKLGQEFQINSYATSDQSRPFVAALADGGFVSAWRSYGQDGSALGVFGQRFDAAGNKTGDEFQVNTHTANDQTDPWISPLSNGGFVVAWESNGQDGDLFGAYAQRYDANGTKVGSEFQINSHTTGHQSNPSAAELSDGSLIFVWQSEGQDGSASSIYGQRFDANGTALSTEFRVNNVYTTGVQNVPSVAALISGGFVVVWPSDGQDGSSYGIYGQRYDNAGNTIGGEFQVNRYTTDSQHVPVAAGLADGGFIVSWRSFGQDGSDNGVYGRRYNSAGNSIGDEFRISDYSAGAQSNPAVWSRPDGGFSVAWSSLGQDGSDYGVFAKVYEGQGQDLSGSDGNDGLAGGAVGDTLIGGAGDDVLRGKGGDDVLHGGAGTDVAAYGGNIADYWVRRNGVETIVEDRRAAPTDGTDTLTSIEALSFADGDVVVAALPEAMDGVASVVMDGTVAGQLGAIDDATSPELLTYVQARGPAHGALTLNADGSWTYTPAASYAGADSFDYKVTDADGNVSVATVTIDVVGLSEPEFAVNSHTPNAQNEPSAAVFSDGGFVIVWVSDGQDGSSDGIYGQRYDADGNAVGPEFLINTTTANQQTTPTVETLADDSFVVAWDSANQDGDGWGVYGRRYDATGAAVEGEFQIHTSTTRGQSWASIAALADGGFVATWYTAHLDVNNFFDVFGQRYDASGTTIGGEFQVNSHTPSTQAYPSVVPLSGGGFLVVWESVDQDGSGRGVYGQRYDANGVTVASEFRVNTTTTGDQRAAASAVLSDGSLVIVWQSDGQDGDRFGIYGQRYDAAGNAIGTEFPVNTTTADWQDDASITALTDGGFVVVWQSNNQDGNGRGVYGRRFDATGSAVGGEFQINDETYGHQSTPVVAARPDGGFIVTWSSGSQDASLDGIYAKVFAGPDRIATGGAGHDSLAGGAGDDILTGDAGDDILRGNDGDDILKGGAGDDRLIGDAGSDHLSGGDGVDTAWYAESALGVTVNLANSTGAGGDAEGDTYLSVENVLGSNAADNLVGGEFDNTLSGAGGNDSLFGREGNDTLEGGAGNDTLSGDEGADILRGGAGADAIDGGADVDIIDYAASGAAVDVDLAAGTGHGGDAEGDTLTNVEDVVGTDHSDQIIGDTGTNRLSGGLGDDDLAGGAGNDTLIGNDGADRLFGDEGDDRLVGGAGADLLHGGSRYTDRTLVLNTGGQTNQRAQADNVTELPTSAFTIEMRFTSNGISASGSPLVSYAVAGSDNELLVFVAATGDLRVFIKSQSATFAVNAATTLFDGTSHDLAVTWDSTSGQVEVFIDGASQGTSTLQQGATLSTNGVLILGQEQDSLGGGFDPNQIFSGEIDELRFFDAVRTATEIQGDLGVPLQLNRLPAGLTNYYRFDAAAGGVVEDLVGNTPLALFNVTDYGDSEQAGTDTADYTNASAGVTVDLLSGSGTGGEADGDLLFEIENVDGSAYADVLHGDLSANTLSGYSGDDVLSGNGGDDALSGGLGVDSLDGGVGADTLDGGAGNDTLTGGNDGDVYLFGRGDGHDTIIESVASSGSDSVLFDAAITNDQIWFAQDGLDLSVSVIGTDDRITIQNWFDNAAHQIEVFETSDGDTLLNSQVQNLVNAMAAFSPPSAGQTALPQSYEDDLIPVISANWQPSQ